jgi:hypothetical protein
MTRLGSQGGLGTGVRDSLSWVRIVWYYVDIRKSKVFNGVGMNTYWYLIYSLPFYQLAHGTYNCSPHITRFLLEIRILDALVLDKFPQIL